MMNEIIKEVTDDEQIKRSVGIIINSFKTVADEFNLTIDNCPTHPSFTTYEKLKEMKNKNGVTFLGFFINNVQAGFIALEKASDKLYYIEKLSVLPECRQKGYGRRMVEYVCNHVREINGKKISIGIINESKVLKDWYSSVGFRQVETKEISHIPFTVCFMEINL